MSEEIIIVSGLPRSGTSMMMQMLDAGGLGIMTDNVREADTDNPLGYYEFETVKKIAENSSWLNDSKGKVVKMISPLLSNLPPDYRYKVIFMIRDLQEILISQAKMVERRGSEGAELSDEKMMDLYDRHISGTKDWLAKNSSTDVIYVKYSDVINDPQNVAERVTQFLDLPLKTDQMPTVVDSSLYRSKP